MSFLLDRQYPASFRGAEFFYISGDITGGRKIIVHEYPNKTFRKAEDLGLNLRTLTIRAKISGFFYEDNKALLEDALNKSGIGILVHPTLGNINCVCQNWTVTEEISSTNVAFYDMTFIEVVDGIAPRPEGSNIAVIANLYREIYDFIKNDLNGQYIANFARNIFFAGQKLSQLEDTLRGLRDTVGAESQNASEFFNQLRNFGRNIYTIAGPNGNIGGQTSDIVNNFDSLSDDGQTRFDASSKLIGFGSNDEFVNIQTKQIIERNNNLKLINGAINALAFTNMIDGAKNIDYQDEEQLNDVISKINNKYDDLINATYNIFSNDLLDKLMELRNQARIYFKNVRLTINKIVEIETKPLPVSVLAYKYYGNTDDYNLLLSLNNNFNPSRIEGTVKIVEI